MKNKFLKFFTISLILLVSIFIYCLCDRNPFIESNNTNSNFWSTPKEDGIILFFRLSDSLEVDSLFAGHIQFRLDCARTVDEKLDSISARKSWEFGVLLLGVSDELYNKFNTTTYRFNYQPLDSLLDFYNVLGGRKLGGFPDSYGVRLEFNKNYNMPILAKSFNGIDGIWCACANHYGILPEGPPFDIWLEIEDNLYKFTFYLNDWSNNYEHFWEVHVIDDNAELITEWGKNIYYRKISYK